MVVVGGEWLVALNVLILSDLAHQSVRQDLMDVVAVHARTLSAGPSTTPARARRARLRKRGRMPALSAALALAFTAAAAAAAATAAFAAAAAAATATAAGRCLATLLATTAVGAQDVYPDVYDRRVHVLRARTLVHAPQVAVTASRGLATYFGGRRTGEMSVGE